MIVIILVRKKSSAPVADDHAYLATKGLTVFASSTPELRPGVLYQRPENGQREFKEAKPTPRRLIELLKNLKAHRIALRAI